MTPRDAAVFLNLLPAVGPVRFKALCARFGGAAEALEAPLEELKAVQDLPESAARSVAGASAHLERLEQELKLVEEHGVSVLTWDHPDYPALLKDLHNAPPVLYCLGDSKALKESAVAVVGSRRATPYGENMAAQIAGELAEAGMLVVSGLAQGIDAAAHRAALKAKGRTVAVLGCGLLSLGPAQNRALAEQISKQGAVLSEFPMKMPPETGHFPRRNRIVSGMSLGTVVVEAAEGSGALITARLAQEQGKDVFAVPGSVASPNSRGCHQLLREGATLAENAQDILNEIAPLRARTARGKPAAARVDETTFSGAERKILEQVHFEPVHIDALSTRSAMASGELSQALLMLEMKGAVRSLPGKMYVRNN